MRIEGKALSALVTVGHRWPVQQRVNTSAGRRSVWQIRTSDQLSVDSSVVRSAPFEQPENRSHEDALAELVGWAWTEGSYRSNGGIHLSQSPSVNPGKCERIEQALTALYGPPMGRTERKVGLPAWNVADYEGTRYWRLNVAAAAPILAAAPDHVLDPAWLLTLTTEQLNLLLETSMLADGTTRVRNGARDSSLSQNRQDRAEGFQFAAILAGRATSIHRWEMQHKGAAYPMWRVSLQERVTAKPLRQAVAEWATYSGIVWCPTVEHGTWLCRRNGLVHWTGNCGAGGSSQGVHAVPGVRVERAANHWDLAIDTHERNFPTASHYRGDIRKAPVWNWPVTDLFWASPECTNWSIAKGHKRAAFDQTMQGSLEDLLRSLAEDQDPEEDDRERAEKEKKEKESRALMEEVPLYLRGVQERGGLVKAGVVENVTDVRKWDQWDRWIGELHKMGYRTRVIALNSMHANPRTLAAVPQSRDRLYVGYWHESLGRNPDWDKWLRPRAYCWSCDQVVLAMQVFKRPGVDMGRYRDQYVYRCPNTACRNQIVEPEALPAAAAIDWSITALRIGDRPRTADKPEGLSPKTMARIRAGLERYARPMADGMVAVPPLLIPVEGRDGKEARTANMPHRAQTTRNETGLAFIPFIAELRGGGRDRKSVV